MQESRIGFLMKQNYPIPLSFQSKKKEKNSPKFHP